MEQALCSVVVCSCDKYSDLWDPYFELFKKFWPDCPYPIYLNTETKTYETEGLDIHTVHAEEGKVDWSSRLIHTIRQIDSEFILLTLDDHFLLQPVDQARFSEVVNYMHRHKRVANMSFFTIAKKKKRNLQGVWAKIPSSRPLRVNCSTTLWRRDRLLSLLREGEDAWQFEREGTQRALWDTHRYYRFLGEPDWPTPILDFAQHVYRGYGVFQGKWLWNNEELFRENGLDVDLSIRGVTEKEEFYENRQKILDSESGRDWRDKNTFKGSLYRHTPKWILTLGSRVKHLFKKD